MSEESYIAKGDHVGLYRKVITGLLTRGGKKDKTSEKLSKFDYKGRVNGLNSDLH